MEKDREQVAVESGCSQHLGRVHFHKLSQTHPRRKQRLGGTGCLYLSSFSSSSVSALCPFSSHPVEHLAVSYRSSCLSKHAGLAQARLSTATFQQTGLHGEGSPCPPFGWVFSSSVSLRCWVWAGNVTPWQVQVVVPSPASLQTAAQSADAPESLFPGYVQMSVFKPSLNCFVLLQMSLCLVPFRTVPQLCSILSNTYQSQNIDKVLPKTELFSQGPALFICLLVIG